MYRISPNAATSWSKSGVYFVPTSLREDCPNRDCRISIANLALEWQLHQHYFVCSKRCLSCSQVIQLFLLKPQTNEHDARESEIFMHPSPWHYPKEWAEVATRFPRFIEIYGQAQRAEGEGLSELDAVGYRKALELLVKDYVLEKSPKLKRIKKASLSQCIQSYVKDTRVRQSPRLESLLGNDDEDYAREFTPQDVTDLKNLIAAVVYWISVEVFVDKVGDEETTRESDSVSEA